MGHMIPSLRSDDVKMLFRFISAIALLMCFCTPGFLLAEESDLLMAQEYFVQQAADEALLIRIDAFEAEFESTVSGQGGNLILSSAIPGNRIVPLFQYINAQNKPRQLDIAVTSAMYTDRSKFALALTRMSVWDDRSKSLDDAYQLLSFGMQAGTSESAANWTVKIDSLINAGRLFKQLGMKEMRLWSNYLAAHLIQFHLHDHSIVFSMCREILAEVEGTRLQKIALATAQLQSAALIGLNRSGLVDTPDGKPGPVQSSLAVTAQLAESLGFYFEQAQALNYSGTEYLAESSYPQALSQYQKAVAIADLVGDATLATSIRESIVDIHALQGNVSASSAVLQEIEAQLLSEGGDELALNLLAQGRLYIRSYQFLQAYEVLSQAINQQNDSAILQQVHFELARVFYATGRLERSQTFLQLADISIESAQGNRGRRVVDEGEGLRMLANIYRSNAEYEQMRKARALQGNHQPAKGIYLYEQGLDEVALPGRNKAKARSLFNQSQKVAATTGQEDLRHLSLLQLCAHANRQNSQKSCSISNLRSSFQWLQSGGVPRQSVEAMYLWAKILVLNGQRSNALEVLDRAVGDIHFYRHVLPGVLGSWYGQRSELLFDYYLGLVVNNTVTGKTVDGAASLLALSKIRFAAKYSESDSNSTTRPANNQLLRIQLGERADSTSGRLISGLNKEINRGFAELRPAFNQQFTFLSRSGLQTYLRSLGNDEIMLTYHISYSRAYVWVGRKSTVQQMSLSDASGLYAQLLKTGHGLPDIGMSAFQSTMNLLGKRLISPVAHLLKGTIYFIPAGSLLGFPLDALRSNGRYLAESHQLVNVTAFPSNKKPAKSLELMAPENVFIAGHPQDYSSNYLSRLDTSTEISAVADVYVGPGLSIVQGSALLPDEFESEQIHSADLIHLSMPGAINLKFPEQSELELSGAEDEVERATLGPAYIRQQPLRAELVFLSSTGINGFPYSNFSNQPALITDFQSAGATAVIANLWDTNGKAKEALVTGFYRQLEDSGNIATSLQNAKLEYLESHSSNGLYDWAGFQLYIE